VGVQGLPTVRNRLGRKGQACWIVPREKGSRRWQVYHLIEIEGKRKKDEKAVASHLLGKKGR